MNKFTNDQAVVIVTQLLTRGVEHIQGMKTRSLMPGDATICAYRGPAGAMCAVGALIPDDEWDGLEHQALDETGILRMIPELRGFTSDQFSYAKLRLRNLQGIHDEPTNWKAEGGLTADALDRAANLLIGSNNGALHELAA